MSSLRNRALEKRHRPFRVVVTSPPTVASAYNHVGADYGRYADGDAPNVSSAGRNRFEHADAIVWKAIQAAIEEAAASGVGTLRVLDAGCGPGTWLNRIAAHANALGLAVEGIGIDIADAQLAIARKDARILHADGKRTLTYLQHDLANPLPWPDREFHLVLCNYVVLNHLAPNVLPRAVRELCRVASRRIIATVRGLASPATGCITGTEKVRDYHQDCQRGELALVLEDGSEHRLTFNLFSAETLKALFAEHGEILELRAIDLFASRFAPDAKWTGHLVPGVVGRDEVMLKLRDIEETLCRLPGWIDHGTHVLIVAEPLPS